MKILKINIALIPIFILAFIMRFYNFDGLQYFSGDEEIFHAVIRRIVVEGKPTLISPSAQLATSIGSFFHLLVSPLFFIARSDPSSVQLFGSILGVMTTFAMYWAGKLIVGERMGLIAATLYAGSFLIGLYDRRLWPLTPDPLLAILAIISLIQISRKKYKYALLLAITTSFAWHADPSISVIFVASIFTFLILKLPFWHKDYLPGFIYLILSVLPILLFEIRHPGTIFRPFLIHAISRSNSLATDVPTSFNPWGIFENFARSLVIMPSNFIEQYLCYCGGVYPKSPLSPIFELIVMVSFLSVIVWLIKSKDDRIKQAIKIILIFITSFLLGAFIYSTLFKFSIYMHYFIIIFPAFFLLNGFLLDRITKTKFAVLGWVSIAVYIIFNMTSLFNSTMKYPLSEKKELVNRVAPYIGNSTFSVYGYGSKYITDGGWTTFFILNNQHPARSYLNGGWDFIYRAHSLYTTNPDQGDGEKVIIIQSLDDNFSIKDRLGKVTFQKIDYRNFRATILDNHDNWYSESVLGEFQKEYDNKNNL